jgi:hypothetical protein
MVLTRHELQSKFDVPAKYLGSGNECISQKLSAADAGN